MFLLLLDFSHLAVLPTARSNQHSASPFELLLFLPVCTSQAQGAEHPSIQICHPVCQRRSPLRLPLWPKGTGAVRRVDRRSEEPDAVTNKPGNRNQVPTMQGLVVTMQHILTQKSHKALTSKQHNRIRAIHKDTYASVIRN